MTLLMEEGGGDEGLSGGSGENKSLSSSDARIQRVF